MEDINETRILKIAHTLFNARGYRNVTVQDLASELGMSKKTIYQYYDGKEAIATAVIKNTEEKITNYIKKAQLKQEHPLLALRETLTSVVNDSLNLSPLFLRDIKKYLPILAEEYGKLRGEGKKVLENFLKKAHEMGLIKDIPLHLVMELLHESLHALIKPEFLNQNNFLKTDVINTYVDIFLSGISVKQTEG
ncbi:TetR/AcrR family transcriptional regulator [Clostridium sp. 'White wine YQ']|uniref:TetR/AcrR family transcriptional regulator n=1 Tax=Clostridium sp. 'White wine YQ' TaxID=3027474 RepID=UPI0023672F5A|nr:TetR/AcrR family transcriptional regulator [Clostridium sp. 'White wine YQ']MDD7794099.1 TetR/AcrR family transcriptional regulator [Clostridium sp. 'White wine YQ']